MPIKVGNQIRKELDTLKKYLSRSGAYEIPMRDIDSEVLHALLTILKRGNYYIAGIFSEDGQLDYGHVINPETDYYCVYAGRDISNIRPIKDPTNISIITEISEKYGIYYNKYITDISNPRYSLNGYYKDEPTQKAVDEIIYKCMFDVHKKDGYSVGLKVVNDGGEDCFFMYELQDVGC